MRMNKSENCKANSSTLSNEDQLFILTFIMMDLELNLSIKNSALLNQHHLDRTERTKRFKYRYNFKVLLK